MGEILIKVNIADRHYPVKIDAGYEESIKEAARMINEKVKAYTETFSVKDRQDALSMYALELATELLQLKQDQNMEEQGINDTVQEINALLQDISN